ncbi:MAG TPA: CPBP family intramembrane metalloprotease [Candidatus Jeotgalibaca pullicola]|nr:CPBP family intramembrane metalloprotease [Candidatus Jeotgalibaca pullicola]
MQKKARKSKRAKFWKSLFIFLILLAVWSIIADIIVIFWGESYPRETGFFINAVKYSIFFLFAKSLIKLNAYSFKKIMGSFSIKKVPWTKLLTINLFIIFLNLPFMATLLESQSLFSLKILNGFLPAPKETLYHLPSSLLMVIFAPFVEEVLFRGFLLNKIGEKQTTASSLLLSSIIFSVFHLNGLTLAQFFAGLFFGICYIQTKKTDCTDFITYDIKCSSTAFGPLYQAGVFTDSSLRHLRSFSYPRDHNLADTRTGLQLCFL